MKTTICSVLALGAVCLLAGCETTGLSSHDRAGVSYPRYILGLQPKAAQHPPQKLAAPIRLAVAQVGESSPPRNMMDKLERNPRLIVSVVGLPLPGEPSGNYSGSRAEEKDHPEDFAAKIKTICGVAQSVGADYLFLFGGNIDSWQNRNGLAFLDFTIIGGAIIPSAKIHCENGHL